MLILLLSLAVPPVDAFNCVTHSTCGCMFQSGGSQGYKINVNDFSSGEQTEIEHGADAWDAGSGEILRGAAWQYNRNADLTVDGSFCDGTENIREKDDTWFTGQGLAADVDAVTTPCFAFCGWVDGDITFRDSEPWSTSLPSDITNSDLSIGTVAMHEFGHFAGLDHEDANMATMNSLYPHGGDIAHTKYRINEDDYVGFLTGYSDASTGNNMMLSRYAFETVGDNLAVEVWTNGTSEETGKTWSGHAGNTITAAAGPSEVMAIINGTSSISPVIEWRLSSDAVCFSGTEYVLGTRTPTISSNVPYAVSPNGGYAIPGGTPNGTYHLCAKIDSTGATSETSESDNIIVSEKLFTVN